MPQANPWATPLQRGSEMAQTCWFRPDRQTPITQLNGAAICSGSKSWNTQGQERRASFIMSVTSQLTQGVRFSWVILV